VSDWQQIPEYKASLQQALGPARASQLAEAVGGRLATFRDAARRLDRNMSAIVDAATVAAAR
jgi:hypothetical protein